MTERQTYSIDQIKELLLGQLDQVVHHYAPPAKGSHTHFGKYFTLNPGRSDRSVGSFYVHMSGPKAGNWKDHAVGGSEGFGDIIDLIALSCRCDLKGAVSEARAFLGLQTASAEDVARRKRQAQLAARDRERAVERDKEARERRSKRALAIWLSARSDIRGTPVDFYLKHQRGIDLAIHGRQPGAIRYLPECKYYHEDNTTGEVIERNLPAMVALVSNHRGEPIACHRTYLGVDRHGNWNKAKLPCGNPKKALGDYAGGWINIWKGQGPRGGKQGPLTDCGPGTRLFVAEGIEDALTGAMLLPAERFAAAISLSNLGRLKLPANVSEVTLIADADEGEAAQKQLELAIAAHAEAGRSVRLWQNKWGGKDLNDALKQAHQEQEKGGAA